MNKAVDIDRVRSSLRSFQEDFEAINRRLTLHREPFTDEMLEQILSAYRFLNDLMQKQVELFSLAGLHSMLELNHIVLCGTEPARRFEYHRHILETRSRFQRHIHGLYQWVARQRKRLHPVDLAVGFYWRALSQPQLFIEGNHRTGNIVLNYLLISHDCGPFFISRANAYDYLELSGSIKFADKTKFQGTIMQRPGHGKSLRRILDRYGDTAYLVDGEES
jgi:hypothetical protein